MSFINTIETFINAVGDLETIIRLQRLRPANVRAMTTILKIKDMKNLLNPILLMKNLLMTSKKVIHLAQMAIRGQMCPFKTADACIICKKFEVENIMMV